MIPSYNSQPAQLQDKLLIEIKKLVAKEYKELNFTFLQISDQKRHSPNLRVHLPHLLFITQT